MSSFTDSLRGYGYTIHKRDRFTCRYCGADGSKSFETWLTLSIVHLLPKGHPQRDDPAYIVTACQFCNTADNRYFDQIAARGLSLDGLTPDELVAQRWRYVQDIRRSYRAFWEADVRDSAE